MAKRSNVGELARTPAQWPAINSRVWVGVQLPDSSSGEPGDEVRLPTRVEDFGAGRLVVAAPGFRGDLQVVAPGLAVTVVWASARGQCRQDFLLAEMRRLRVACWDLAPCTDVVIQQRRRFVRATVSGRAHLSQVPEDPMKGEDEPVDALVGGSLIDLSEGGVSVNVAWGSWLRLGRLVRVAFDVEGSPVEQLAQVVRLRPAVGGVPGREEVMIGFLEPVPAADRLRRYVMQAQIRYRRGG
ncbi:MAG: PilZ domain-containing protein, partial [Janthinobacterium lividum]